MVVIAVILAGVLVIPTIQDITATENKYTNSGYFYATAINDESEDTLSYDYTNPSVLTINGVNVDMSTISTSYDNVTVAFSDKWFIRYAISTGIIYLYETDTEATGSVSYASPSTEKNFSLTCASGTATIVIGSDTYTETITGDGLIISSEKSEYVMKKSMDKAYVNSDSLVYGAGRTDRALGVQGSSYNAIFKASVDDGVTVIGMSPNTYSITDSSVTYTDLSGSVLDLYELTGFSVSLTDGVNSGSITYNQIFVPSEITGELAKHLDSTEVVLLGLVSVLILVAIVMMAVRMISGRSD